MIGHLLRRLVLAVATLLVAVSLVFLALRALPGNPLLTRFGRHPDAEQIHKFRREQGWDRPVAIQLREFLWKLATTGDLGESFTRSNERVRDELFRRIPATLELTGVALLIALPLGIGLGVSAAVWRSRLPDFACVTISLLGVSIPVFFLGICLRSALPQMPVGFRLPATVIDFEPLTGLYLFDTLWRGRWDLFGTALRHLCLPAIVLSTIPIAYVARITRGSMLEMLRTDFVRTAVAKGASRWRVVLRHAFPNAALPIVNIAAFQVGLLLSGAVLTETVFDWPGLGKYVVDAVRDRDYTVVQGGALFIAFLFVTLNLGLDLVYIWLDPRMHHA